MNTLAHQHHDLMGRPIALDTVVAYPANHSLQIGRVVKIDNNMIRIVNITAQTDWAQHGVNKYPADCMALEDADITMYLLRQQ